MIRIRQIKININEDNKETILSTISKKLGIKTTEIINYKINKKSIDARNKEKIMYIYEIDINTKTKNKIKYTNDVLEITEEKYEHKPKGTEKLKNRPVIVGSGPCGLFCAYKLAQNGYKPIIIERGEDMDNRIKTVNKFWQENKINKNSNVQFGEGGAGTFSDGKLSTQIKDKSNRIKEVLNTFVLFKAPEEIKYDYMPHIGTDKLRDVVKNMRNKIIELGGEIKYNTCLTDITIENNKITSITLNEKEKLKCDVLVLAIGHSARDTFRMLNKKGISMTNKPFAVGLRVMHPQEMINKNQFGKFYKDLRPASYKLTYNTTNGKGVYSFCMCPGGYVVNASSDEKKLVVNGMSNYERESGIANSAIVVTVNNCDYGNELFDGIKFQENLEKKAYTIGDSLIPIQRYKDYCDNKKSTGFTKILPKIKGKYNYANLNELFSDTINKALKEGMENFGKKIKGFNDDDVILAGVETRTSSPIRIYRDENYETNIKGIYPAGEGAGYAGGIVSSAVDGIKIYESITDKYENI